MIRDAVTETELVADFFHEGSNQPRRTVILLGGSEGGNFWSRQKRLLEGFVKRGYCVLSLAYFKAPGLPRSLEEIPLEYFEKAFAWLGAQPQVSPEGYALVGGSKGAEAALLLGSRYPQVKAVAALLPSSVVWQGIPKNRLSIGKDPKSSWSFDGKGLPYVPSSLSLKNIASLLTLRLRKSGEKDLQNTECVKEAAIPVEKIQGAILLISGKRDQLWPSTYMCEQMVSRLAAAGFAHHYEHIAYDKGHTGVIRDRACWRTVYDFLEQHFPPNVAG